MKTLPAALAPPQKSTGLAVTCYKSSAITEMAAQCCTSRFLFGLKWGYLSLTPPCCRQCRSNFNHCDVLGPKASEFGEM